MNSRLRGILILLVATIVAVVSAYIISGMIQDKTKDIAAAQRPIEKDTTVVAAADIPPGWTITADDLRERELPKDNIPDDVFRTAEEVVGRVASERILGGEFIREERLAAPEAGIGLPAIIPRGMRALQVPLRGASAVSGFVNPGNFVDVIAVCSRAEPPEVRTLLQAVSVLAVNDRMVSISYDVEAEGGKGGGGRTTPSVTLALSPKDAGLVKHAFGTCDISLTLRNDIDVTAIESNDRSASDGAQGRAPTPQPDRLRAHG